MGRPDAIELVYNPQLCVAGQDIFGEVVIHFPQVIEDKIREVHVKLRGAITTEIDRQVNNNNYNGQPNVREQQFRDRADLIRENVTVFTPGQIYPPPGSDTVRLPFQFRLPPNLPSSFHYKGVSKLAAVQYSLEAVGVRDGMFHLNRRTLIPFPVVSADFPGVLEFKHSLQQGWRGQWVTSAEEVKIRRGIWGDYSNARMELYLPSHTLPLFTPIPYMLRVITLTKPMKADEVPGSPGKPLFPAPPSSPAEVLFRLDREILMRASIHSDHPIEKLWPLGGLGKVESKGEASDYGHVAQGGSARWGDNVRIESKEKTWVPSNDGHHKGVWRQESELSSTFTLDCTPSFESELLTPKYKLHLDIDFPGMGNHLKMDVPVQITSGMLPNMQAGGPGYAPQYIDPSMPAPQLALPQTYWSGNWTDDQKS